MHYLATANEMKQIDATSIKDFGMPELVLMERAALAVTEEVEALLMVSAKSATPVLRKMVTKARILVVVENGNNGGDGLAVARQLIERGYNVDVVNVNGVPRATESFNVQKSILEKMGVDIMTDLPDVYYDVIVDAIFGVGLSRDVAGRHGDVVEWINTQGSYVVAVDMPSGVNATTGAIMGTAVKADVTVTFGLKKLGQVMYPGAINCGKVLVKDIGFPKAAVKEVSPKLYTFDRKDLNRLPKRSPDSNKGTVGKVAVIAGSETISGAAVLATLSAYKIGAGMVKVYTHEANKGAIAAHVPEALLMTYSDAEGAKASVADACTFANVLLIGPGIGTDELAETLVNELLATCTKPVVADADALNILAKAPINFMLRKFPNLIITPHMKEMSRLTGKAVEELKAEPVSSCKEFADKYNLVCAMKDARTVVSDGGEKTFVNTTGNHGMATAGSGDVLSGITAAVLAAGTSTMEAARLGVLVHGLAGDMAASIYGTASMTASDIANEISTVLLS